MGEAQPANLQRWKGARVDGVKHHVTAHICNTLLLTISQVHEENVLLAGCGITALSEAMLY